MQVLEANSLQVQPHSIAKHRAKASVETIQTVTTLSSSGHGAAGKMSSRCPRVLGIDLTVDNSIECHSQTTSTNGCNEIQTSWNDRGLTCNPCSDENEREEKIDVCSILTNSRIFFIPTSAPPVRTIRRPFSEHRGRVNKQQATSEQAQAPLFEGIAVASQQIRPPSSEKCKSRLTSNLQNNCQSSVRNASSESRSTLSSVIKSHRILFELSTLPN